MKKKITIEDLAGMVKRGFDDTHVYMDKRFEAVDRRFEAVDRRFDDMDRRFDRIENMILKRHEEEIEQLKIRMRYLEDMLAVPLKK
ncbi:MAG: hypothetical protein AAB975_02625 [Patescibacteria group bacterium]